MNQTQIKIVADSSANLTALAGVPFAAAPLKIITDNKEYTDDESLNPMEMVEELSRYRGRSSTSCPSPEDWMNAFGDAERIFCITITSGLSGSYNAACIAKEEYEDLHPDRKVHVIDSLSAGPELALIAEKLKEGILAGKTYEESEQEITAYTQKTALLFMLESLKNLANNGRVKPIAAKTAELLGIRMIGKASTEGTLELMHKVRGEKRVLSTLWESMKNLGYQGGKVRIAHCGNEPLAIRLKDRIRGEYPQSSVEITPCGGLCSFYAEKGGLMIGLETE